MILRSLLFAVCLLLSGTARLWAQVGGEDDLSARYADGMVAIAEDKVITVEDVRNELQNQLPTLRRESHNQQEFNQRVDMAEDQVIQELIDRVLIVKEFHKDEKRHVPESFVTNQIAEDISRMFDNDQSKFLAYLRSKGMTYKDYQKQEEEDMIYDYMLHEQRKANDTVSPVRIEQYYKENKQEFYQDDRAHMRLIQLNRNAGDTDSSLKAKAQAILARFKAGEKFEDLAKEFSDDNTKRVKGGDWGWQRRTELKPELGDALFALKKGEASEPVLTQDGCFILYAEDRSYAGIQPLDKVRDQIENIISTSVANANLERWKERLRRNGYVKHF